jgi:hypothetical protein
MRVRLAVTALAAALVGVGAAPLALNFSRVGQFYHGIGALSGGGGVTRLLLDYDEAIRSDVLDALFKPKAGASLQLIKVEIGGDTQVIGSGRLGALALEREEPRPLVTTSIPTASRSRRRARSRRTSACAATSTAAAATSGGCCRRPRSATPRSARTDCRGACRGGSATARAMASATSRRTTSATTWIGSRAPRPTACASTTWVRRRVVRQGSRYERAPATNGLRRVDITQPDTHVLSSSRPRPCARQACGMSARTTPNGCSSCGGRWTPRASTARA